MALKDCAANKKPLKRGLAAADCETGSFNPGSRSRPIRWRSPASKLGREYTQPTPGRSIAPAERERPARRGPSGYGTEEGTRTPTAYGHYHLKVACLPIPPPRQKPLPYCSGTSGTSAGADCPSRTGTSPSTAFF